MPKKVNKTEENTKVVADAKNEVAKVENKNENKDAKNEVAKVEVKKERKKREKKVVEPSATVPVQDTQEPTPADTTPKTRQTPTRESVEKSFDELSAVIDEEVGKLRDSAGKAKGVKFLKMLNKRIKLLKNQTMRISKQRHTTHRNNANSGFLKPVQISKELAKFTGWDQNQPRSRVDVTKFICNYIKEKNLQDPKDRRQIRVEDDADLKKLLKFDGKEKKPLTYYSLQTYLKGHFPVQATPVVPAPVKK